MCVLDLWLSSLFVAFISICFSSLWKTTFYQARQLLDRSSTAFYLSSLLNFFSQQKLTQFRSIEISGVLLNRISTASSIHRETFYLADRSSIDSRSIEIGFYSIAARQLLDLSGPSCMHCFFFHMFCICWDPLISLHSCIYLDSLCPLIIFMFLKWSFIASCTLCQSWQKGREIVEKLWFLFLRFYMLGGEIHAFVRGRCVSTC